MEILLVEDNPRLITLLDELLAREGMAVRRAETIAIARQVLSERRPDALLLDLGLPDGDGFGLLEELRADGCSIPILVITARDEVDERVRGLDAGADDYVVKPFAASELLARLRAVLRRPGRALLGPLALGNLTFDPDTREAWVNGVLTPLSAREADLLEVLLRRSNRVLSRDSLAQELGREGEPMQPNALEVLVHRLRLRLDGAGASLRLHTLRGLGYLLQEMT